MQDSYFFWFERYVNEEMSVHEVGNDPILCEGADMSKQDHTTLPYRGHLIDF